MLDTESTFNGLVARYAGSADQAEKILSNRFYRNISGALSGTQEYMATEKLYELSSDGEFDLIVVDTPPTRNTLDFLEAPGRLAKFLGHPLPISCTARPAASSRPSTWPRNPSFGAWARSSVARSSLMRSPSSPPSTAWRRGSNRRAPDRRDPPGRRSNRLRAGRITSARHGRGGCVLRPPSRRHAALGASRRRQPHLPVLRQHARRRTRRGSQVGRRRRPARRPPAQPRRARRHRPRRPRHLGPAGRTALPPLRWWKYRCCPSRCTTSRASPRWATTSSVAPDRRTRLRADGSGTRGGELCVGVVDEGHDVTIRSNRVVWSSRRTAGRSHTTTTSPSASDLADAPDERTEPAESMNGTPDRSMMTAASPARPPRSARGSRRR